jgi:hypothetical protein
MKYLLKYIDYKHYKISQNTAIIIFIIPIITFSLISLLVIIPATRGFCYFLLKENELIEILTFIIFFVSGFFGLTQIFKLKKKIEKNIILFYGLFSLFLILIAMEEIAWGQWFFYFETPDSWNKINIQGETTLHNIKGIQGRTAILRFLFGLGGIIGIVLKVKSNFKKIYAPSILFPWFSIIFVYTSIELIHDFFLIGLKYEYAITKLSEFIELLIAGSSFLFLWLNFKKLRSEILQN